MDRSNPPPAAPAQCDNGRANELGADAQTDHVMDAGDWQPNHRAIGRAPVPAAPAPFGINASLGSSSHGPHALTHVAAHATNCE